MRRGVVSPMWTHLRTDPAKIVGASDGHACGTKSTDASLVCASPDVLLPPRFALCSLLSTFAIEGCPSAADSFGPRLAGVFAHVRTTLRIGLARSPLASVAAMRQGRGF